MTHILNTFRPNRRGALAGLFGAGLSLQFLGSRAFAAGETDLATRRLVVIICRGGMDGLAVAPPVGDANYARLRGSIAIAPPGQAAARGEYEAVGTACRHHDSGSYIEASRRRLAAAHGEH